MSQNMDVPAHPSPDSPLPHQHKQQQQQQQQQPSSMATGLVSKVFIYTALFGFAIFNWFLFLGMALTSGTFFKKPSDEDERALTQTRDKLWNLSKQPVPGFRHAFFKLRSGQKLHFITNRDPNGTSNPSDLVVFIHGFPDSSMIWRHVLQEPELPLKQATFVCVDMPGFGGSDSFKKYDTQVLEALAEFIIAMRARYTQDADGISQGLTYVAGHDWGCVVTLRLAADAPGLADRFITSNGPLIELTRANQKHIFQSSLKIFKQFRTDPIKHFGLLKKSYATLKPLLRQAMLSGYIFVFNLPAPFVRYLATGGNQAFSRGVAEKEHGKDEHSVNVYETLGALRPGPIECKTVLPKSSNASPTETYDSSVAPRAASPGTAFWHMTAYYRDNLAHAPWEKSIELIADLYNLDNDAGSPDSATKRRSSSASSAMFGEQYKGSIRAPLTMLWGLDDIALSKAICLEGISDYLAKDSEVIILPRSGHWTPLEKDARRVWAKTIKLLVNRPKGKPAPTSVFQGIEATYPGAQLYVRR